MSFLALMDGGGQVELMSIFGSCRSCSFCDSVCNNWFKLRLGREVRLKKWMAQEGFPEARPPWQKHGLYSHGETSQLLVWFASVEKGNSDSFFQLPSSLLVVGAGGARPQ